MTDFQIGKVEMSGRFTNRLTWREMVSRYRLSVPATPERNISRLNKSEGSDHTYLLS
jgi:hypothetical protein